MLTRSEEDHIKAVHTLLRGGAAAGTKDLAERLNIKASSVTVMLRKLAGKGLLKHEPYYGVKLTAKGRVAALKLVRKHRLWETFLVERLGFKWNEVHDVAEQLEHVQSEKLTESLAEYLGDPAFDPHGDPIPDRDGRMIERDTLPLTECGAGTHVRIAAVKDGSDALLQLLDRKGVGIGMRFVVLARHVFDDSVELQSGKTPHLTLSAQVAAQLLMEVLPAEKSRKP